MSVKVTVQDALKQVELVIPRISTLSSSASGFQSTDGPEKALKIHNEALAVKEGLEILTPYAINIQRPVSVDDGRKILKLARDVQQSVNNIVDNAIQKKPLLEALPVGNIAALIAQDLRLNYDAMVVLVNALLDAAPTELQTEAKVLQKEFEDKLKNALAVYQ
ncbi:hypothetical protein D9756_009762 [Leucocoprinus leucothites]|uniref:Uncharacterized protein n=1 Tax=Leucocoprinus leucothites TaxID=201217 RepID=A0A8H5CXE1_9AGAR|nr:hypothetical protein D9756_009762 [Leucoagaricus leucothites]